MTRTAILGWGSLIYDLGSLSEHVAGTWVPEGPNLLIEFSRISVAKRHGALTLVLDENNGAEVPTQFIESSRTSPNDAVRDLKVREETATNRIGLINLETGFVRSRSKAMANLIADWARQHRFDAVVWTDLPSNFAEEKKTPFTITNAINHLQNLSPEGIEEARQYINKAPENVITHLRRALINNTWWKSVK